MNYVRYKTLRSLWDPIRYIHDDDGKLVWQKGLIVDMNFWKDYLKSSQ